MSSHEVDAAAAAAVRVDAAAAAAAADGAGAAGEKNAPAVTPTAVPSATSADNERRARLKELKAAAEAQMRRPAPAIGAGADGGGGGGSDARPAKRARGDRAPAAAGAAADDNAAEAEAEALVTVKRYNYAAPGALLGGARCMLMTCQLLRQMSATKEGVELLKPRLPAGTVLSLVKVGCRGLVLVLVERQQQQQQQQQEMQQQQDVQQQSAEQTEPAAAGSGSSDGSGSDGGDGSGGVDVVEVAAAVLADVEAGAVPRTRCAAYLLCLGMGEGCKQRGRHRSAARPVFDNELTLPNEPNERSSTSRVHPSPPRRFVERIVPGQTTSVLEAEPLRAAASKLCRQFVAAWRTTAGAEGASAPPPIEFAVAFKNRAFEGGSSGGGGGRGAGGGAADGAQQQQQAADGSGSGAGGQHGAPLQRQEAIAILAQAMADAAAAAEGGKVEAHVNLKAPNAVIIAEVVPLVVDGRLRPLLALAVVEARRLIGVKVKGLQVRSVCKA